MPKPEFEEYSLCSPEPEEVGPLPYGRDDQSVAVDRGISNGIGAASLAVLCLMAGDCTDNQPIDDQFVRR